MDIDWTRHIVIGLVSALVVFALTTWASKSPPDQQGWRNLKPGGTYIFAIGLGTLFTIGMAYVWLFVGSSRPDGESQMRILFWLIVAFGLGTLITLFQYGQARRTAMRWRGDTLCWRSKGGVEHTRKLIEAVALRRAFMGPIYIVFGDGVEARVDPYANNAMMLIQKMADRLYPHGE
jgi:MFS family permease